MRDKLIEILADIDEDIISFEGKSLIDEGLVDSFTIVEILSDIEDSFGIAISKTDVIIENFDSVDAMLNLLNKYLKK